MSSLNRSLAISLVTLTAASAGAQTAQFFPIPGLSSEPSFDGGICTVSGSNFRYGVLVSGNGQVVATITRPPETPDGNFACKVLRWTEATGSVAITPLNAAEGAYPVTAISFDGQIIYGDWWRWRANIGYQDLRRRLSDNFFQPRRTIFGCSNDGQTVVGTQGIFLTDSVIDFFRWNPDSIVPPEILPRPQDFAAGYFYFNAISGDGNVVAGTATAGPGLFQDAGAVINASGVNIVTAPGGQNQITDLSFNGSVAVGTIVVGESSVNTVVLSAIRWTAQTGSVLLDPNFTPSGGSFARAVNADGSVVVGEYLNFGDNNTRAFYWRQGVGVVDLFDALVQTPELGTTLSGWQLTAATDVSADGRTIVGAGINPQGCEQAFLIRLPAPAPAACTPSDIASANQAPGADGTLTADDIIVYLGWFFASDERANVAGPDQSTTPDANFTADDIIVFLGRFFVGC